MLRNTNGRGERRGIILLVVMAMLALFASVALSFVFYAEAEATTARYARQAEGALQPDVEPELLMNYFLGQLIYDTDNEFSALRGHGLARLLYGSDPTRSGKNGYPFNGAGVLRYPHASGPWAGGSNELFINYTRHDSDGKVRDPEYYDSRNIGAAVNPANFRGGANVPWTYPGLNNVLLAAVNADGEVLIQSGHRPFNGGNLRDATFLATGNKYLTLRPHKSYHPNFEDPADLGGDVKCLPLGKGFKIGPGTYANNDSYWMDLGFPVLTAPNGAKYKPLFAFLVIDLDGKVNLQVAGNIKGASNAHVSNHGLGPWEINPAKVVPTPAEMTPFLQAFRYGGNGPGTGSIPAAPSRAPFYSRFDFDAANMQALSLPAIDTWTAHPSFPADWTSRDAAEANQHPAGFGILNPLGGDKVLRASHLEALLRYGGKNSPGLHSELYAYLNSVMTNARARNLTTLLSMDFERAGLLPYLHGGGTFTWTAGAPYPKAGPLPFPNPANPAPAGGDFEAPAYSSNLARLNRIDLSREFPDYPVPNAAGLIDLSDATISGNFFKAQQARQRSAQDIFTALIRLTGADPNFATLPKTDQKYWAARWLAQLSINIVDYLDRDHYMTPFKWNPAEPDETLFGVEPTRLVINEAMVLLDNDPTDPGLNQKDPADNKATFYRLDSWLELHNPIKAPNAAAGETYPLDNGIARLKIDPVGTNHAGYRVVMSRPDTNLRVLDNHYGKEDTAKVFDAVQGGKCIVADWDGNDPAKSTVLPGGGKFEDVSKTNDGFFVVGPAFAGDPKKDFFLGGRDPNLPTSFKSPKLSAKIDAKDFELLKTDEEIYPTFMLQRLPCPHIQPQTDSKFDNYNPYVTVDYVENVPFYDSRTFDHSNGLKKGIGKGKGVAKGKTPDEPVPINTIPSLGRRQPYAATNKPADLYRWMDSEPDMPPTGQPKHTFYRQNTKESAAPFTQAGNTCDTIFDWLLHLDRPALSPIELLHVTAYRPHELTQVFLDGNGVRNRHVYVLPNGKSPWLDQETLLYRFLDLCYVPDPTPTAPRGGRTPGRININTVWDKEVFRALCDATPGTLAMTDAEIDTLFQKMISLRTPSGSPAGNDRPFLPVSVGFTNPGDAQQTNGLGRNHTLLSWDPTGPPNDDTPDTLLVKSPGSHPYEKLRLLQKIFNNTTTRSNCFAVWCTVGFFEVTDETTNPPKLGKEIGKDDNRHIRHKFFAIIDRTNVRTRFASSSGAEVNFSLANPVTVADENTPVAGSMTINGTSNPTFDTLYGGKFTIGVGSVITISPDTPREERVTVDSVTVNAGAPSVTFNFQMRKSHSAGDAVVFRCHPGPQPRYDVRKDGEVVPHYAVIE